MLSELKFYNCLVILNTPLGRQRLTLFLFLLCGVFLTRPHMGVIGDAVHYTLVSLHASGIGPSQGNELLLPEGRANYTVFPLIFGNLISWLGVSKANAVMVAAGLIVWLSAGIHLSISLFGVSRLSALSLLVLVLSNSGYVCSQCSGFAEPLATPRLFGEGLALIAMSFAFQERFLYSTAFLAMGALVHPLMTLPAFVVFIFCATRTGLHAVLILGAIATSAVALAAWDIMPFAMLMKSYPSDWFAILQATFPETYFSHWEFEVSLWLLPALTPLLIVAVLDKEHHGKFCLNLLIVYLSLTAASWLGSSVLNNVLIVNLHPWRVSWVIAVFGLLYSWYACLLLGRFGVPAFGMAAMIAVNVFNIHPILPLSTSIFVLVTFFATLWTPTRVCKVINLISISLLIGMFLLVVAAQWPQITEPKTLFLLCLKILLAAGFIGLLAANQRHARAVKYMSWPVLIVVLFYTNSTWDQSWDGPEKYSAKDDSNALMLEQYFGSSLVYWEGDVNFLWFYMRRASFFSCYQAASNMIDGDIAYEWARRGSAIATLNTLDTRDVPHAWCPVKDDLHANGPNDLLQVKSVCAEFPELGTVALAEQIPGSSPDIWLYPSEDKPAQFIKSDDWEVLQDTLQPGRKMRFLYRCAERGVGNPGQADAAIF